jgi:phospholipase D1/2
MDETPVGERIAASARSLVEGDSCWCVAKASRAAVLVDGADYFGALRRAMLDAKRSIVIVGWDIDGRTRLTGEDPAPRDGAPHTLRELLSWLVERRPELHIYLLLWDFLPFFSLEREVAPTVNLGWRTPERVHLCLDSTLPIEASQHEKIVVIDDSIAFVGGLDLTIRRWDTPRHQPSLAARVDPDGIPYGPFHDLQVVVEGEAALRLADLVRQRWRAASAISIPEVAAAERAPWPAAVRPDFRDVRVGISRTRPRMTGSPEIAEVKALYLRSIEQAQRFIYVENQYLTCGLLAGTLCRALERNPRLEVVIVSPAVPHGWLEIKLMSAGRNRFLQKVFCGDYRNRVRFIAPKSGEAGEAQPILIHSKAMIVDDRLLRIGSSNFTNRSMGLDSECDLTIEARRPEERRRVTQLRSRLLAEHLGAPVDRVEALVQRHDSLVAAIDELAGSGGRFDICEGLPVEPVEPFASLEAIVDAEKPVVFEEFLRARAAKRDADRPRFFTLILPLLLMLLVLGGMAAVWQFTAVGQSLTVDRLEEWIDDFVSGVWSLPIIVGVYVALGLLIFPVTLLIAATAAVFGPWLGFAYSICGSIASAVVVYGVGALIGKRPVRRLARTLAGRIGRAMGRHGILTVVGLRIAPVAPFSVVNFVAGASRIKFKDFVIGSALGMLPGIIIMCSLGSSLAEMLRHPTPGAVAVTAGIIVASALAAFGLHRLIVRRRDRDGDRR